jgi:hypothetical protein
MPNFTQTNESKLVPPRNPKRGANMGLIDVNNKAKPAGRKFAELAAEFRTKPRTIPTRRTALVIPDHGLSTKAWPPDWRYATPYMHLIERGLQPAIVLESRAHDADYLRARGIVELIPSTS